MRTSSGGDSKGAGSIYVTGDTSGSAAKMNFGVAHNIGHGTFPKMTIDGANGRVGIGTAAPSQILHINDASPIIQFTDTNGLGSRINADNGNLYLDTHNQNRDVIFRGGSSSTDEVARVTGDGKVGIGTAGPSSMLTIRDETGGQSLLIEGSGGNDVVVLGSVNGCLLYTSPSPRDS